MRLLKASSPGAGIGSPCFCSCRGGAEEGRLGDSQRLVLRPLPRVRLRPPHRKMRANQGLGAGLVPSRPPSGLIESYIKKFSSEERRGRRREGQRRSERGRASKTGRSALESPKHERDNRSGIFLDPVLAGDPPPEGMAFQEPRRVWERQGPLWPCGRAAWDVGDDTGNLQPLLPVSPQWEREAEK